MSLELLIVDALKSIEVINVAIANGRDFRADFAEIVADEIDALHDAVAHDVAHRLDARFVEYCALAGE